MNLAVSRPIKLFDYNLTDHCARRKALGTVKRKIGDPIHGCEYCWPTLIAASFYDDTGRGCCAECGGNPNRVAHMPRVRM